MKTIERTQVETCNLAAEPGLVEVGATNMHAKPPAVTKPRVLLDWELAYVSGGQDQGCW
jgi:hypothetical protein